jgi:hypothetical protein
MEVIIDTAAVNDLIGKAGAFVEDIGKKLKLGAK